MDDRDYSKIVAEYENTIDAAEQSAFNARMDAVSEILRDAPENDKLAVCTNVLGSVLACARPDNRSGVLRAICDLTVDAAESVRRSCDGPRDTPTY